MTGTIPIVGEGVNEVIDFGFTNKITLSGENKWGGTKADILGNLGDWTDKVLTGGFANVDMAILGKEAKKKFFRRCQCPEDDGQPPHEHGRSTRDPPNGVKYLGHLTDPSLDLYAYGGSVLTTTGQNPEEPRH
ncbi:MAG: major capsid protein [Oscillospiraceae bacterium]